MKGSEILLINIVSLIPGEIRISVDSTVERRKGPKIKSLGIQRDAVRSTKARKVLVPGLHWLVFAIHIKFPWCKQEWALPLESEKSVSLEIGTQNLRDLLMLVEMESIDEKTAILVKIRLQQVLDLIVQNSKSLNIQIDDISKRIEK